MLLPETLRVHDKNKFEFEYLYFLPWKDALVNELERGGAKVMCFPARNNIQLVAQAKRLARYVRDNDIQIIHAHLPWAGIVSRLAGRFAHCPVFYTEHNKQERYHSLTRFLNLATMNLQSKVIAVSVDVADSIRRHKPRLKADLQTIVNGVNTERFKPGQFDGIQVRHNYGIPLDAPLIGTIAVFRVQKRLDLWLEIAKAILEKIPTAHFMLVGEGPLKAIIESKAQQLRLGSHVHFTGTQTEVRPYLAAFDLFMMSSVFEGLPVAMLEAMASGCPVVSTDAGGIKEIIRHGGEGYLCSVDDPRKLIAYACELLADRVKLGQFGQASRQRIVGSFSIQRMVHRLEACYETQLAG